MSMVSTVGGLDRPRLRVLEPRSVGWAGGGSRALEQEAAAGAGALVLHQWSPPPPDIAENNDCNTTVRRVYIKSPDFRRGRFFSSVKLWVRHR